MNKKVKKGLKIVSNIGLYVFIGICVLLLIFSITGKKNNGATNIFGHQMRVVISRSMEKCSETDVSQYAIKDIPLRSMVFIQAAPEDKAEFNKWCDELKVGDVLTFMYYYSGESQVPITHRIIEITPEDDGGYKIVLQGDNKPALEKEEGMPQSSVGTQTIYTAKQGETTNYFIVGKVTGQSYFLGLLVTAVSQPLGIVLIVIVPCLVIVVLEIVRIVGVLGAEKKKKAQEKIDKQESEIEMLKRQIEQMQKVVNGTAVEESGAKPETEPVLENNKSGSNDTESSVEIENKQ